MTLEQLRYFVALARWEHVGRAARAAAVSPSALSTAVSQLEADLGRKLFDRIGRSIHLNAQGQSLLPRASAILEEIRSMRSGGELGTKAGFRGRLRLAASPFLAAQVLSAVWGRFREENPEAWVDLEAPSTGDAIARVLRGELDAALVFSPQSHPDLRLGKLHEGRLLPAARADHPVFRRNAARRFPALAEFPLISHKGSAGVELCEKHEDLLKAGISAESSATFSGDDQAVRLMTGSSAWGLLPDVVIRVHSGEIRAIPPPGGWRASYRICWVQRVTSAPSTGLTRFKDLAAVRLRKLVAAKN